MSDKPWWKSVHPAVPELTEQFRKGRIDRREFLRTVTLLGVSATAAYALAGQRLVAPARAQMAKQGGNLRVAMFVRAVDDPAQFNWSEMGNIARQFIEPLVQVGTDNVARPYLLEGWQPSEDLKTWTLKLRKGITWSNGDEFNADDVIFNIERWLDPATGSSNQARLSAMTHTIETKDDQGNTVQSTVPNEGAVERVDDHTVVLHLGRPELAIPESFGDYPALIVNRRFSDEGGVLSKNPVGTGPFELVEYAVNERATVRRREGTHWTGEVFLDSITYIDVGGDPSAELAAFASGQIDINYQTGVEQIPAMRQIPGLVVHEAVTGQTAVARMRTIEEPWGNKKLRQAIQATIDHARVLEVAYSNFGVPGEDHHVSPVHPEYAKLPPLVQDYDKAKRLLAEAGFADGFEHEFVCINVPWELNSCQAIVEMARPAGINLKLNVLPGDTYWDRWDKWPFSFTSWTHRVLGTQVLNLAYRTGGVWNEAAYSNPEYDRLLDEASG
ncbi:MAG: ABC transporter substrate-binding protein, partial [Alphaproteobacteria bacterium]